MAAHGNTWRNYLENGFWLIVPVLVLNVFFAGALPPPFQMSAFWTDIPASIGVPENVLRVAVFFFPLLFHLSLSTRANQAGLAVYLVGLAVYGLAWFMMIVFPTSAWSESGVVLLAPAYTPLVWLTGIALMTDRLLVSQFVYRPWMYVALSAAFLVFHISHTAIVVSPMT